MRVDYLRLPSNDKPDHHANEHKSCDEQEGLEFEHFGTGFAVAGPKEDSEEREQQKDGANAVLDAGLAVGLELSEVDPAQIDCGRLEGDVGEMLVGIFRVVQ